VGQEVPRATDQHPNLIKLGEYFEQRLLRC